jgi:nicotinamidase-related amidase
MADNLKGSSNAAPGTALLLIDVINDLEFDGGENLWKHAKAMVEPLRKLRERARRAKVPIIYANDNFGRWHSDFEATIRHAVDRRCRGKEIAEPLLPDQDDYFVLKPQLSAFHGTPLEMLLDSLQSDHLILTGLAGNLCVMVTAHDAHMRGYKVSVPRDCMASETDRSHEMTLHQMSVLKIETPLGEDVQFHSLRHRDQGEQK